MGLRQRWPWIAPDIERLLDGDAGAALEPLRQEIFGAERFRQHAHGLAQAHRARRAARGRSTFHPRLQSNIRTLRGIHALIAAQARDGHDLGPAASWLFDNFHLIEAQLEAIREGLPPRFYRSLPVLCDAPLAGLPRIYGVAWAFVAHTDSAFDASLLVPFLNAYQDSRELSQGELWALPTTLRVVLVENLRRLSDRIAGHRAARELAHAIAQRSPSAIRAAKRLMNQASRSVDDTQPASAIQGWCGTAAGSARPGSPSQIHSSSPTSCSGKLRTIAPGGIWACDGT